MSDKLETVVLKNFGPSVLKVKIPQNIVDSINQYIDGIEIVETKFISLNDVVCSIIKSSEPIKIRFNGTGFYNPMNLPTFDGDEDGIPWQQNIKSKVSFQNNVFDSLGKERILNILKNL